MMLASYFFSLEIPLKAGNHPSGRYRLKLFSLLCWHSKYELAQGLVERGRRYFVNIPELTLRLKNMFLVRLYVCLSSLGFFLFSCSSIKSSTVPSRRANRYITAIFFPFSSRNPLLFIGFCIFGYHGNVKSFAPLIGIHAHCRSAS